MWIGEAGCMVIGGRSIVVGGTGPPLPAILAVALLASAANFSVSEVRGTV